MMALTIAVLGFLWLCCQYPGQMVKIGKVAAVVILIGAGVIGALLLNDYRTGAIQPSAVSYKNTSHDTENKWWEQAPLWDGK